MSGAITSLAVKRAGPRDEDLLSGKAIPKHISVPFVSREFKILADSRGGMKLEIL